MNSKYVFDTYAILEILQGNGAYDLYLDSDVIINNFIFAELCYVLHRDGYKNSQEYIDLYTSFIVSLKPEWIEEAMKFRVELKKRNVSVTDCVSYIMAKRLSIPFLTGDKEFKDMDNVVFVK